MLQEQIGKEPHLEIVAQSVCWVNTRETGEKVLGLFTYFIYLFIFNTRSQQG